MAVLPILVYGDPRLEAVNQPVEDFGEKLRSLIEDLFETGWKAPGLGLAAPQVGVNLRIATIDPSVGKDPAARMVLANPEIISHRGEASLEEGCLSFPGLFTTIPRPTALRVRTQDESGRWRCPGFPGLSGRRTEIGRIMRTPNGQAFARTPAGAVVPVRRAR